MTSSDDLAARLDRLECEAAVRRLAHEYCHGADERDLARFAAVWTDDAVWAVSSSQQFTGLDEICDAVQRQWSAFRHMHHRTTNLVITQHGDTAEGEADVEVLVQYPDGTWHRGGGVYRDRYRRTPSGWRIARREAEQTSGLDPPPADRLLTPRA